MEMVLISDIHLGRYKYGKMQGPVDTRTLDILDNIQIAFDYADKHNIKTIAALGDFYHTKRPAQVFRRMLVSKFEWALNKGIKLYLMLGNHDQGKTHGHDLVELVELSKQIENLVVIEKPDVFSTDDSLLCFLPHVNAFDLNIPIEDFHNYVMNKIKELTKIASQSTKKYKFFFAHFGTDKSLAGKGFDMGSDENSNRVVPLSIFDPLVWTHVYLGDIHKQQEMNSICRHVGSIAKVDFGEEGEKKGFYHVTDDKDEFIEVNDREFKTLFVDLTNNYRESMSTFCESVQEFDLSKSITRLKISINEDDLKLINFSGIEDYLKENSWNYVGKLIHEIRKDQEEIRLSENQELNYVTMFRDYVDHLKLSELKDEIIKSGETILSDLQNA